MIELNTEFMKLAINEVGQISSWIDLDSGIEYLPQGQPAPIMTIRIDGEDIPPTGLIRQGDASFMLNFGTVGVVSEIGVTVSPAHITFELGSILPVDQIELITWGPYPTIIEETIGETVGVVRNGSFAIGIQALNEKTLGGLPIRDDDVMPSYNIFDSGDYSDIAPYFKDKLLYRGNTAVPASFGSLIQAYCRNRNRTRIISNWGHDKYVAPAYEDGGVVGSRIALFGCPPSKVMDTIENIELSEDLPHPTIDGQWAKTSRQATASYVIMDFGEATIEQALTATSAAGLEYLYHSAPFETWGHFKLKSDLFPGGWDGFKTCVKKAAEQGIKIGFHTLSNFTTPNDPYVSPIPDPRLARIGSTILSKAVNDTVKTIPIDDPDFFRKRTTLNTVCIDHELITFKRVSSTQPWRLLECTRGAFGTTASPHDTGSEVGRLLDHPYRVFLTDADLAREQAQRIAAFCNHTGAMQLSFDGLEGNWSTGLGQYGRTLFTAAWYHALSPELQGRIINDASNPGHFNWHIYTRMNWGEPWYAGFRESQTLYRLMNQYYYSRNLMPRMLGWFALRGDTSIEDAEWLLARAAGFDAGFSLATSLEFDGDQILPDNDIQDRGRQSNMAAILEAVNLWENARMAGLFPSHLKPELQDVNREFHLERGECDHHLLYRVHSIKQKLHAARRSVDFENPYDRQPLGFIIQHTGKTPIERLTMTIGRKKIRLADRGLQPGEKLKYDGKGPIILYNADWGSIGQFEISTLPTVESTVHKIKLDWLDLQPGQTLQVEYRTLDEPELLA